MSRSSVRVALNRSVAALLCVITVSIGGRLHAAPADVFSSPAPAVGADPPKAAERRTGDTSVSTQTGALTYSYPITVPPGRGGMAPSLALTYSSQAPIYGGIASGWSLPIPMILEDTSLGRLRTHSGQDEVQQGAAGPDDDRFISTMAGSRPLVRVLEPPYGTATYRAQNDASYTRYQRFLTGSFYWRAYTTDGNVLLFGETSRVQCPDVGPGFAPLTSQMDSFGNEVAYVWKAEGPLGECRITEITWGMNANAGIINPFARVVFGYGAPTQWQGFYTGSRVDYRTGKKMISGASRLLTITVTAFPPTADAPVEHTRVISLGYDGSSENGNFVLHSPQRILTSIQESAWRSNETPVVLPAVTFAYESAAVVLASDRSSAVPWADPGHGASGSPNNLGWGWRFTDGRWPTVEQMFVDLDGDGLPDRLTNTSSNSSYASCTASWQRNKGLDGSGNLVFATPPGGGTINLPRLKWGSGSPTATPNVAGSAARRDTSLSPSSWEDCSLNAQMTTYRNSTSFGTTCHDGSSCYTSSGRQFCAPGGTRCPPDETGLGNGDYRTYLAYRWLDVDADGLTDLVAAIHGSIDRYDVALGNWPTPGSGVQEPAPFGLSTWPACPGTQVDQCKDVGTQLDSARHCDTGGLCAYDWATVNTVLNSSPAVACFKIMARQASGGAGFPATQAPYTRCEGLYPWFVFRNQGNGSFPAKPEVKYQPVPLESDSGDSSLYASSLQAQNHGIFDFDGDGVLDGVVHGKEVSTGNPDGWYVWLGDGTGGMSTKRYYVPTRKAHTSLSQYQTADAQNRISAAIGTTGSNLSLHLGTVDLNGDGLPDHYLVATDAQASPTKTNLAMNNGTTYQLVGSTQLGEVDTPNGVYPTTESVSTLQYNQQNVLYQGDSNLTNRLLDVDGDGRVDIVRWDGAGVPTVFYNLGGQFLAPGNSFPGSSGSAIAARRHISASQLGAGLGFDSLKWELTSDVLDLDGDGIPEGLRASSATGTTLIRNLPFGTSSPVAPPRLLKQITNNRGLNTFITYASMHEDAPSGSETVKQSPNAYWWDQRPKATPATLWVTKSIRVEDEFDAFGAGSGTTTSYKYENPRHGTDDQGQYAFRGFEKVTTTSHSGARTEETFDYQVDWSGRLVKSVAFSAETPTRPVTVDMMAYSKFVGLFAGTIATFHPTLSEHFVCADVATETEATCATNPNATPVYYTRTESTFELASSNTDAGAGHPGIPVAPLMYLQTKAKVQHQKIAAEKDRQVLTTYWIAADETTYRVRPLVRESQAQDAMGAMVTFAKSQTTWDPAAPAYARKLSDTVWFDASTQSTTNYNYEASTGNLLSVTTPRGNTTSYEYDARKLFVAFDNSPFYAHDMEYSYEYGTGVKLETRGPNWAPCTRANPPNCNTTTIRQTTQVKVDGLGRPLEVWATVNPDANANNYELRKVGVTSYVDTSASGPTSVTTWSALRQNDVTGEITYAAGRTDYDGHGRPTKVVQYMNGSTGPSANDNVTAYAYRLDGTLQTVSIQNPTATTASLVSYTYNFDSLGRPTGVARPDSGSSGATVSYKAAAGDGIGVGTGVFTDTVEVAGGTAKRAELRRTLDADGRLIKVEEKTADNGGNASAWATTLYEYDAAGNVEKITDAEGKVTTLAHDWAGHRTSVDRGNGRLWKYTYDADGNVAAEVSPQATTCAVGDSACRLKYTTALVYDALDRLTIRALAPRDLPTSDLDLFGAVQESYQYDVGSLIDRNDHGRVTQWRSVGLNSTGRQNQVFGDDPQGNRLYSWGWFNAADYTQIRTFGRAYTLGNAISRVEYADYANGGTNGTTALFDYDMRGLPSTVKIAVTPGFYGPPITDTRNIAGLVTKRRLDYPASPAPPMSFIESAWTYDILGRVLTQSVNKGTPAATQVAKQTLTYFDNDDVTTLRTDLGTTTGQVQTFGYDYRHQLVSVAAGSQFGGTYVYGNAGRFTQATVTRSGSGRPNNDIVPRNVFYKYASTDPELVTSLNTNALTGPAFMTYTYDLAGNMLTKVEASTGNKWEYLYDGSDRLRRATKKTSSNVVLGIEEYWYDYAGNRSQLLKRNGSGAISELVWFHEGTEAHYGAPLGGGNATVTYAYAHVPMARVRRTSDTATTTEYQFHGLASSLLAGVESNGTNNVIFNYAPFGEVVEAQQSGSMLLEHKRRLNDKQQDDLTGLFYYGARYYDRTLMGWTQLDPLYRRTPELAQELTPRGANLAVFSLNNPARYLDPDGRDAQVNNLGAYHSQAEDIDRDLAKNVVSEGGDVDKSDCAWNSRRCFRGRSFSQASAEGRAHANAALKEGPHGREPRARLVSTWDAPEVHGWRRTATIMVTGVDPGPDTSDAILDYASTVVLNRFTFGLWSLSDYVADALSDDSDEEVQDPTDIILYSGKGTGGPPGGGPPSNPPPKRISNRAPRQLCNGADCRRGRSDARGRDTRDGLPKQLRPDPYRPGKSLCADCLFKQYPWLKDDH